MSQDYEDFVPADRARRPLEGTIVAPHRGQMIMVMGILSLFMAPLVLGPMAWIMGRNDLKEMAGGRMDRSGRDNTNTGTVCGMIATILWGSGLLLGCIFIALCMGLPILLGAAAPRPAGKTQVQPVPDRALGKTANRPAPTKQANAGALAGHDVTQCPHCNQRLFFAQEYDDDSHFRCARCNKVFKGP